MSNSAPNPPKWDKNQPETVYVLEIDTGTPSQAEIEAANRRAQYRPENDEDDSCPF